MINYFQHQNINIHHSAGNSQAYHTLSGLIKQSMLEIISSPPQLRDTITNINYYPGC